IRATCAAPAFHGCQLAACMCFCRLRQCSVEAIYSGTCGSQVHFINYSSAIRMALAFS
ncbi:hypothetical protein HAX54_033358, partial [Datura stramonium]|nr:hypothetical protein [Datura stramonium]